VEVFSSEKHKNKKQKKEKNMKLIKTITAATVATCCAAITSQAALILPAGNTGSIGSLTESGGSVVGSLAAQTFLVGSGPQTLFGTIATTVYSGDANNIYGLTGYTFVYNLIVSSASPSSDTLNTLSLNNFTGVSAVNVGYNTASANITSINGSLNVSGVLSFNFNGLAATTVPASATIVVDTAYHGPVGTGFANIIDGSSPAAAVLVVPETTTMMAGAMLLLPFGFSTIRVLRSKSAV
jgi:hypothetical protein